MPISIASNADFSEERFETPVITTPSSDVLKESLTTFLLCSVFPLDLHTVHSQFVIALFGIRLKFKKKLSTLTKWVMAFQ